MENSWFAIRTFHNQEQRLSRFLTESNCVHFVPMKLTQASVPGNEAPKTQLVPAVHNLLFVQKMGDQQQTLELLKQSSIPFTVFRLPGSDQIAEIPECEMVEIRTFCDPQFNTNIYLSPDEADAVVGKEVRVINGPFKGSIGRLVRKKKQYYLLKVITGMGVMVRIPRWYCEPLKKSE